MSKRVRPARPAKSPLPAATTRLSPSKLWAFRLAALAGVPLLLFLLLEGALRVIGFGYPTGFLLRQQEDGHNRLVQNNRFGWRFFGRQMARAPHPIYISVPKPTGTFRIVVMGESAAYGDPDPAFGLSRMIQAMLELRHPGRKFEVINAAMTGINSHVIRYIAQDWKEAGADAWVLYIGNNEVVGPFGAGTVFGSQTAPMGVIRGSLAFKATRIGQLLDSVISRGRVSSEWGGMTMFLKQQVAQDDPRMRGVYDHFAQNLRDIVEIGLDHHTGIVLCTLNINLADCPPFAAAHSTSLSADSGDEWDRLWQAGLAAQKAGKTQEAEEAFQKAGAIDAHYATLRYVLGQAAFGKNDREGARTNFAAARDLDTLRFRCDSHLQEVIRSVAKAHPAVKLAEIENSTPSWDSTEARADFYDHVHLTFEGNYKAASKIVPQIERLLPGGTNAAGADVPSLEQCARRLGWSDLSRRAAWLDMLPRLTDPPFINQIGHEDHILRVQKAIQDLNGTLSGGALGQIAENLNSELARHPHDAELALQTAVAAEAAGQTNLVLAASKRACDLLPSSADAWSHYAAASDRMNDYASAIAAYCRILAADPDAYYAYLHLGEALERSGKPEEAIGQYRQVTRLKPRFGPAWLSLGRALESQGKVQEAQAAYAQAMKNRVRSAAELIKLAEFCRQRGMFQAAATNMLEAISLNPASASAYLLAGEDLSKAGQHAEAIRLLTRALEFSPDLAPAHFLLGRELGLGGNLTGAEREFREASRLMPELVEARINLALTIARQGRKEEAIAEYKSILEKWPENAVARRNLDALK